MTHVTVSAKRYSGPWVYVCPGCGLLDLADRIDKTTCSTACRVRAHRSGELERLRRMAIRSSLVDDRTGKPRIAGILHGAAIDSLRPDLGDEIMAGRITIAQAMPDVVAAFWVRLRAALAEQDA